MMSPAPGQPLPPRKDRRDLAREKARVMREEEQKRQRRRRLAWRGGVAVALVAVAAIVAVVIVNGVRPASAAGPRNMASDGILLTGDGASVTAVTTPALAAGAKPAAAVAPSTVPGAVKIATYVDYLCPYCGQFETANAQQITGWVTAGNATLEVHPIAILDSSSSGTKYSTRAANAAACVADLDPNHFLAVNTALFAKQPAENTAGLSNAELTSLVKGAGVTDAAVPGCITDQTFASWVKSATDRALAGPLPNADVPKVNGTPTVLVNGKAYSGALGDATAFAAFVQAQAAAGAPTSTPTPTPGTPAG